MSAILVTKPTLKLLGRFAHGWIVTIIATTCPQVNTRRLCVLPAGTVEGSNWYVRRNGPIACWRPRGRPRTVRGAIMTSSGITEADLADLVQRCQAAAAALIRGDVRSYLRLFVHADD